MASFDCYDSLVNVPYIKHIKHPFYVSFKIMKTSDRLYVISDTALFKKWTHFMAHSNGA